MSGPYYVAAYGGFLVSEEYDTLDGRQQKLYTVCNVRLAKPFDSFEKADAFAKWAVHRLYPPDLRYFAILGNPFQ